MTAAIIHINAATQAVGAAAAFARQNQFFQYQGIATLLGYAIGALIFLGLWAYDRWGWKSKERFRQSRRK